MAKKTMEQEVADLKKELREVWEQVRRLAGTLEQHTKQSTQAEGLKPQPSYTHPLLKNHPMAKDIDSVKRVADKWLKMQRKP